MKTRQSALGVYRGGGGAAICVSPLLRSLSFASGRKASCSLVDLQSIPQGLLLFSSFLVRILADSLSFVQELRQSE